MRVLRRGCHSGLKLSREFSKRRKWSWVLMNEKDLGEDGGAERLPGKRNSTNEDEMRRLGIRYL